MITIKTKHFINLTNGIEAIPTLNEDYSFIRIQSTACEQHLWDNIIQDLDYNFLMSVALGYRCIIYDFGANKQLPRASYQGVEFIKYVLNRYWLNKKYIPCVKRHNCSNYFDKVYLTLNKYTFNKLKYIKRFINTNEIHIEAVTNVTKNDGNYEYYIKILHDIINNKE